MTAREDAERLAMKSVPAEAPAKKAAAKKTVKAPAKKATPRKAVQRGGTKSATDREKRANDAADNEADKIDQPVDPDVLPEEREEWFQSPGFRRMKTEWTGDDRLQLQRVQGAIERRVFETFQDAYIVLSDLYDVVREHEVDPTTGEILKDAYGFTVFKKHPVTGVFIEDWTRLTYAQRDNFLMRITTALFDWEQRSADLWTEAMFSKAMFTEHHAIEFDKPMAGTIDDRNAVATVKSADDRYFALMLTAVSRKAEALVRTMTNLQLRLKDTIQQQ